MKNITYTYQVIIRGDVDGHAREWAACLEDVEATLPYALSDLLLRAGVDGLCRVRQIKIVRR